MRTTLRLTTTPPMVSMRRFTALTPYHAPQRLRGSFATPAALVAG
jgi:hypothetical protein